MKEREYYWVYILQVSGGKYYTGYTADLSQRYQQHLNGTAKCKYTTTFPPVKIEQCWKVFASRGTAMRVENLVKRKKRKEKEHLIENPSLLKKMILDKLSLDIKINSYEPELIRRLMNA